MPITIMRTKLSRLPFYLAFSLALLLAIGQLPALGQAKEQYTAPNQAFTLDQAVNFALANSILVKNSQSDINIARAKVGEIRSIGLPQVTGTMSFLHNIEVQSFVLEFQKTGFTAQQAALDPTLIGKPTGFALQLKNSLNPTLNVSQLLFNGSYIIGLRAASAYTDLSRKELKKTKVEVKTAVSKAYYQVLVGQERITILDLNIERLQKNLTDLQATYKSGFVEKIDVDRLEVAMNNLKTERTNAKRLIDLGTAVLKFQMNYPSSQAITLTDKLSTIAPAMGAETGKMTEYERRPDYDILSQQERLTKLDMLNKKAGYLPTVAAFGNFGINTGATKFGDMLSQQETRSTNPALPGTLGWRWYKSALVGLSLNVPIFDGFEKRYKVEQVRETLRKIDNSKQLVRNQIDLEVQQANISLQNAQDKLENERRNADLAKEILRVSRVKYEQGVGSNLEVFTAESSLKESQTNYYTALYDALVAKIDYEKATGTMNVE